MEGYREAREKLEAILKEELESHDMDVHLYNIYDNEFSLELRCDGNLVCILQYESETNKTRIMPFLSPRAGILTNMIDDTTEEFKEFKQVFLYSEVVLCAEHNQKELERFFKSQDYKDFIKEFK